MRQLTVPAPGDKIGKKIDYLAAYLQQSLAPLGFQRKNRVLWRVVGEGNDSTQQLIDLQGDKWNAGSDGKFRVNLGTFNIAVARLLGEMPFRSHLLPHIDSPTDAVGLFRGHIGDTMPESVELWWPKGARTRGDYWIDIDNSTDLSALAQGVTRIIGEYSLTWLDAHSGVEIIWMEPDFWLAGYKLSTQMAAGLLLPGADPATLFRDTLRDKGYHMESQFNEMKTWALAHGLDVADVQFREIVREVSPHQADREAQRQEAIKQSQQAATDWLTSNSPIADDIDGAVRAYFNDRFDGSHTHPKPLKSRVGERMAAAPAEVQRQIVLAALQQIAIGPLKMPARSKAVYGHQHYVHDHYLGELAASLLKQPLPATEAFMLALCECLRALAPRCLNGLSVEYPWPMSQLVQYLVNNGQPWKVQLAPAIEKVMAAMAVAIPVHTGQLFSAEDQALLAKIKVEMTEEMAKIRHQQTEAAGRNPAVALASEERRAYLQLQRLAASARPDWHPLDMDQDDWARELRAALPTCPSPALRALIDLLAEGMPAKPTAAWQKDFASRSAGLNAASLAWIDATLPRFAATGLKCHNTLNGPLPGIGAIPGEAGEGILLGLIPLATDTDGVHRVLTAAWTVIPGIRVRAQKIGSTAATHLAGLPGGKDKLSALLPDIKQKPLRKVIEDLLKS